MPASTRSNSKSKAKAKTKTLSAQQTTPTKTRVKPTVAPVGKPTVNKSTGQPSPALCRELGQLSERLQKELDEMTEKLRQKEDELGMSQHELEQRKVTEKSLQEELVKLRDQVFTQDEIKNMVVQYSTLEQAAELESLTEKCGKAAQDVKALQDERVKLQKELGEMTEKYRHKDEEYNKYYGRYVAQDFMRERLQKEFDEMTEKLRQKEEELSSSQHELEQRKVTENSLHEELGKLKKDLAASRNENLTLTEKCRQIQLDLEQMTTWRNQCKGQLTNAKAFVPTFQTLYNFLRPSPDGVVTEAQAVAMAQELGCTTNQLEAVAYALNPDDWSGTALNPLDCVEAVSL
eukprot:COSAG01_NODE_279_length_19520_cov_41.772154_18_plen_347_part_00